MTIPNRLLSPGGESTVPLSAHRRAVGDRRNYDRGFYVGPPLAIPPLKSECSCACSEVDDLGRPVHIGLCGPSCERRPR